MALAVPWNPVYTYRMDAKQRYRMRLKLQAALLRVLEVLADNMAKGIAPDRTTAEMAAVVVKNLLAFAREAGLTATEALPAEPEVSRFVDLKVARKRETAKRKARARRRGG